MSVLLLLSLAYTLGVGMGHLFPTPAWVIALVIPLGGAALVASLAWGRGIAWIAIVFTFCLGWIRVGDEAAITPPPPRMPPCSRIFEGRVTTPPVYLEDRAELRLELVGCSACLADRTLGPINPTSGDLILSITNTSANTFRFRRNDHLRFRATIRPVVPRVNPGGMRRSYPRPLFFTRLTTAGEIAPVRTSGPGIRSLFDQLRHDLGHFWRQTLPPNQANLARALTLGEAAVISPTQRTVFRRTGTAHLLAVSGLHLGLLIAFVFALIRFVLIRIPVLAHRDDVGRFAAILAMPLALAFTLLASCRPPVVRACVMVLSALLSRALGRQAATVEAVALAGVALLAFDPELLTSPGFQLSFAAVFGFIAMGRPDRSSTISTPPEVPPTKWRVISERCAMLATSLFRASLAAAAATTPLVIVHFNYVSLTSVPINMLAVPLTGLIILPGLLIVTVLALLAPAAAAVIAQPLGMLLQTLERFLTFVSSFPCTVDHPSGLTGWAITVLCGAVLLALAGKRRCSWFLLSVALLLGCAGLLSDAPDRPRPGALTVDFLDVGQGDATLITFPDGRHWLVDAGGSSSDRFDVGEQIVVPALRALGVSTIDTLMLTHPDVDHVGGMPAVLDTFAVERLIENGQGLAEGADPRYHELLAMARAQDIPIERPPRICGSARVGGVLTTIVHPCHGEHSYDPTLSFNDNSIVLNLTYGRRSFLLPGDISTEAEQLLIGRRMIGPIDILKLPHHGSNTSSSAQLLELTSPAIGVASAGLWNRHGIPHRPVLRRLAQRGIRLLRTDRMGAIRISTDGKTIEINRFGRTKQLRVF